MKVNPEAIKINKTDFEILKSMCAEYTFLSIKEISKLTGLHIATISQRIKGLWKIRLLKRKEYGKGFAYMYDFSSDLGKKFRLFFDSYMLFSNEKIKEKIKKLLELEKENILTCIVYGSCLLTDKFNDIDVLIIGESRKASEEFDFFNLDLKSFRELYSLGEPRIRSALMNGRIVFDKNFIFEYIENGIPKTSSEILKGIEEKIKRQTETIEKCKSGTEKLKKEIKELLSLKALLIFSKNNLPMPARPVLIQELKKNGFAELAKTFEELEKAKNRKQLMQIYFLDAYKL